VPTNRIPPFSVLHVCLGNICRSPMAERLLAARLRDVLGDAADELVYSHSAGTGGWHEGEPMNPPAARQLQQRGASADGFMARRLTGAFVDSSDLILTATGEQAEYVRALRPDATGRVFVLGEFGRLLPAVDGTALPPFEPTAEAVLNRGVALVAEVDKLRAGRPPRPDDDLDDPWGLGDRFFARVADEIESTLVPFVKLLVSA